MLKILSGSAEVEWKGLDSRRMDISKDILSKK